MYVCVSGMGVSDGVCMCECIYVCVCKCVWVLVTMCGGCEDI